MRAASSHQSVVAAGPSAHCPCRSNTLITQFPARLTLDLRSIGGLNCPEKCRIIELAQDFDVGHDTMAADDTWEVLGTWKKRNLFIEGDDFFVRLTHVIAVPLNLLGPGNHQAEIGCLGQLRELGCFRCRQDFGLQAREFEMLSGALAAGKI